MGWDWIRWDGTEGQDETSRDGMDDTWTDTWVYLKDNLKSLLYSKDSIIRPSLINFKPFENGLSAVLMIESFEYF